MNRIFFILIILTFSISCSKPDNTNNSDKIDDRTYIITATNFSIEQDISLTIKTSLQPEKNFTIKRDATTKIYIRAAAGEYVQFSVSKVTSFYLINDSKGTRLAEYSSLPYSTGNTSVLDFIAFDPNDTQKDILQYKTGLAKLAAQNLIKKTYLLTERYFIEDGINKDNSGAQLACSYDDEYKFIPYPGEKGNFNPERLMFTSSIDKKQSSCSYSGFEIMPTNAVSIVSNIDDMISFPIWDPTQIDGNNFSMIYRQFILDSINSLGVLTLHRNITNNKKEVFVYKPK